MQPTFVDFETFVPFDHGVLLDELTGARHAGDHHVLAAGGRAVLGGISVTAGQGEALVVTVVGHADPVARRTVVLLGLNGRELASFEAVPRLDEPVALEFPVPAALLTRGRDLLSLSVDTAADGPFHLHRILIDGAAAPGAAEKARQAVAEEGELFVYRTEEGAPGEEQPGGILWLKVKGQGRAGVSRLAWRLRDGSSACVAFTADQRSFAGHRSAGQHAQAVSFRGRVVGMRALERKLPRPSRELGFLAQLQTPSLNGAVRVDGGQEDWQDVARASFHLDLDDNDAQLAELSWTDRNGDATSVVLSADGRTFFGHYQRSGEVPRSYRGRRADQAGLFPFQQSPDELALTFGGPASGSPDPIGFVHRLLGPAPAGAEHLLVGELVVTETNGWIGVADPSARGAAHGYIPAGRYPVVLTATPSSSGPLAQFVTVVVRDVAAPLRDLVGTSVSARTGLLCLSDTTEPESAVAQLRAADLGERNWQRLRYDDATGAVVFGFRNGDRSGTLYYLRGAAGEVAGVALDLRGPTDLGARGRSAPRASPSPHGRSDGAALSCPRHRIGPQSGADRWAGVTCGAPGPREWRAGPWHTLATKAEPAGRSAPGTRPRGQGSLRLRRALRRPLLRAHRQGEPPPQQPS